MTESAGRPVRVIEETAAYWKVVFDYPPFNMVDAAIFEGLQDLLARMDGTQSLRVAVFESATPDFYLAHFDLTGKTGNMAGQPRIQRSLSTATLAFREPMQSQAVSAWSFTCTSAGCTDRKGESYGENDPAGKQGPRAQGV